MIVNKFKSYIGIFINFINLLIYLLLSLSILSLLCRVNLLHTFYVFIFYLCCVLCTSEQKYILDICIILNMNSNTFISVKNPYTIAT